MNQYPGFVPMVVPQPFVVAMPTALPIPGAIGHGLSAMPQVLSMPFYLYVLFDDWWVSFLVNMFESYFWLCRLMMPPWPVAVHVVCPVL